MKLKSQEDEVWRFSQLQPLNLEVADLWEIVCRHTKKDIKIAATPIWCYVNEAIIIRPMCAKSSQ